MTPPSQGRSLPGRRRWAPGLLVAAVALAISLGAIEVVLRWLEIPFRATWTPTENAMAQFDPERGWSYIPGRSYVRAFGSDRRPVAIHFDSMGARVASAEGTRDPDRPTVFFVGGSYTMGHGLPYEETFVGRLDGDPAFPFQVVNLGVQGYGTDQALLLLERYLDRFRCAAVVYTFIDDHVLRNANDDRRLIIPYARFLGTKPRFALAADGTLRLEAAPARYEEMFQLHLWNWMRLVWYRHGPLPGPELTRALIRRMRDATEARGAQFVVVYWRQEIRYPESVGQIVEWEGPSPLQGIDVNVLDTGVEPPAGWDGWVIPGDYHPDARAHRRVAGLLRDRFAQLRLSSARPGS